MARPGAVGIVFPGHSACEGHTVVHGHYDFEGEGTTLAGSFTIGVSELAVLACGGCSCLHPGTDLTSFLP